MTVKEVLDGLDDSSRSELADNSSDNDSIDTDSQNESDGDQNLSHSGFQSELESEFC